LLQNKQKFSLIYAEKRALNTNLSPLLPSVKVWRVHQVKRICDTADCRKLTISVKLLTRQEVVFYPLLRKRYTSFAHQTFF